jgi:hypothetical protein
MTININGYQYTEPAQESGSSTSLDIYEWNESSPGQTVIAASIIDYPVNGATYRNRTMLVAGNFPAPVKIKMGFSDALFAEMPINVSQVPVASFYTYITIPEGFDGDRAVYFKTADAAGNQMSFVGKVNMITLEAAPIGLDTTKLLRNRKFFHNNSIKQWDGKEVILP